MNDILNIVVVGKSGVGKSSFLNYLLEKEVFRTGIGIPVTKTYFDKRELPPNDQGVRYVLYDTKGIEPTTTEECKRKIFAEIDKRDKSPDMFSWIHSVYYCFDSTSARVEQFECDFINALAKEVSVMVLLTKKDVVSQDTVTRFSEEIRKRISPSIVIIPVCSIKSKGTRKNPGHIKPEGKDMVLKASFYGLWNKIAAYIPNKNVEIIKKRIEDIQPLSFDILDKGNIVKKYIENEPTDIVLTQIAAYLEDLKIEQNKDIFKQVFSFYKKVNRFRPRFLHLTETQDVLDRLNRYNPEVDKIHIKSCLTHIQKAVDDLDKCVFWNSAEKMLVEREIEHYKETVSELRRRLHSEVDKYLSTYMAELKQYGQLCISNEKSEENDFDSVLDLSNEEVVYAEMVKCFITTLQGISSEQRSVLDRLRELLNIGTTKAGRIEDYVRYPLC